MFAPSPQSSNTEAKERTPPRRKPRRGFFFLSPNERRGLSPPSDAISPHRPDKPGDSSILGIPFAYSFSSVHSIGGTPDERTANVRQARPDC